MTPVSALSSGNLLQNKRRAMRFTGTMFYENEIIKSLTTVDPNEHKIMVFEALRRVVFERDQQKKLKLYLLDYNSCELFYGTLSVTEGLSKFIFKGKQVCFRHDSSKDHSHSNNHAFSQMFEEYFKVN